MNYPTDATPEAFLDPRRVAPATAVATRPMYWSLRRELWESRSIYIAPLAVAALVVVGHSIATIGHAMSVTNLAERGALFEEHYRFAAFAIMGTTFVVAVFYCLDALYGERRDRSILFWKSLPVSDLTTVMSKAAIPLVVLPLLTFVITVITQTMMLLMSSAVLMGSGLSVGTLWARLALPQTWGGLLYHLVAIHSLWYAPIFGWLLLVSAWARRAPVLWAAVPLLAIALVEKIAFNTTHFANMLGDRMAGGAEAVTMPGGSPMDPMTHLTPGHFLTSPGLWIGLAMAAAFLAGAVRLRRYQAPI